MLFELRKEVHVSRYLASYDSSSLFLSPSSKQLEFCRVIPPISSVNRYAFVSHSGYEVLKFMVGINEDLIGSKD